MQNGKSQEIRKTELKKLEEVELEITLLDDMDIVATSGEGCPSYSEPSCLSAGTKITMPDGTEKNIEEIEAGDFILAFDHELGCFVGSEVHFVYRSDTPARAFTVSFSDGGELSVVGEHDLFEKESMKYVTVTDKNASQFVGRHFYSAYLKAFVELTGVKYETKMTDYYSIYTSRTLNCIANGMLNVADDVDYMLNIYEFDEELKADGHVLMNDIKKFGLFTAYENFGYSHQEYSDWNIKYVSIVFGKGLRTFDEIMSKRNEFFSLKTDGTADSCVS